MCIRLRFTLLLLAPWFSLTALAACGGRAITTNDSPAQDAGAEPDTASTADAHSGVQIPESSPECKGAHGGPTMAFMPGGYCIDRTEVTRKQYADWLATNPSPADQPPYCALNTTFDIPPSCSANVDYCKVDCDDHPVVCVDWCDTHAYCRSVGKRRCGKIGGGPAPQDAYMNPSQDQWYAACSSGGKYRYTYRQGERI